MQVSVSRIPFVLSSYAFAQPLWETAPHNTTKQLGKDRLSSQETEKHTGQTIKVHIWSYPIHPCPKPFPLPSGAQLTPPVSCNHPPCTESCPSSPGLEIPAVHRASHQVSSMCRHGGQRPGGVAKRKWQLLFSCHGKNTFSHNTGSSVAAVTKADCYTQT